MRFSIDKNSSNPHAGNALSPISAQDRLPGFIPTRQVDAVNEKGELQKVQVAGEYPLTITLDGHEVVTLMTMGMHPSELALGFLRNQYLIEDIGVIQDISLNLETETINVRTSYGETPEALREKMANQTVTSGCGQGTIFSCAMDKIYEQKISPVPLRQSVIYALLQEIKNIKTVYKQVGAIHACALCSQAKVDIFIEDVGRHNAADAISGRMWRRGVSGKDKILYTTGRLTSEMVMKAARMQTPVLLSRSGVTHMAMELARDLNLTLIARAKMKRFLVYHGHENIVFDATGLDL